MKLERMDDFFAARVDGYDEHMRTTIEGASDFYAYTASLLPMNSGKRVLDLGYGTGLELEEYFRLNPDAEVTGIDLSEAMLKALKEKFPDRRINLLIGSYFDVPFGEKAYDAAVSVESLHHFPAEQKVMLYRKLHAALKDNGCFVLTDYFAESEELEKEYFQNLKQLKKEQGLSEDEFFHYDTPLIVEHETQALKQAGFSYVPVVSINFGGIEHNSGFSVTPMMFLKGLITWLYGDFIMLLNNQVRPYETEKGTSKKLMEKWREILTEQIRHNKGISIPSIRKNFRAIARDYSNVDVEYVVKTLKTVITEMKNNGEI